MIFWSHLARYKCLKCCECPSDSLTKGKELKENAVSTKLHIFEFSNSLFREFERSQDYLFFP